MQQVLANKNGSVGSSQNISLSAASLEQNTPNPYTQSTAIAYTIPAKFSIAKIIITDNTGKILRQVNISTAGKGMLHVDAGTLASGVYNYSLLVDEKLVDTKKMVLANN